MFFSMDSVSPPFPSCDKVYLLHTPVRDVVGAQAGLAGCITAAVTIWGCGQGGLVGRQASVCF